MYACPYCNGLKKYEKPCPQCFATLTDIGKVSDYYLDYSPYREIDDLKLSDGFPANRTNHNCIHFLRCANCQFQQTICFKEELI